jgi:predicted membrane protein
VGSMTLRVPQDVGVRVQAKTFLVDFSKAGLEKRGSAWVSPGYDNAKRRAQVKVTAVLGGFEVVRTVAR